MPDLIDWFTGRTSVERCEGDGLDLAIRTIKGLVERTFRCRKAAPKTSDIHYEEILEFIQEGLPQYYSYTTRVKTYEDRNGVPQAEIRIAGTMGLSRRMNKYNPLDIALSIRTETPRLSANR